MAGKACRRYVLPMAANIARLSAMAFRRQSFPSDSAEIGWGRRSLSSTRSASFAASFGSKILRAEAPTPVTAIEAEQCSSSSLAAELPARMRPWQRSDTEARCRAQCRADEGPVDAILASSDISLGIVAFVFGRARMPPPCHGVIVVSAGVDDFALGAVREVNVGTFVAKTERPQDGHAGESEGAP